MIELSVSEHIGMVVLARPPVNALSYEMIRELIEALSAMDANPDVRVVVLTGQGRCFSTGVDLKQQLHALETGSAGPASLGMELYHALLHGKKPTIAAINGPALGAGLGIAASCCILAASENAVFGIPEINVGMLGGARHAMRLLGHSTVNRMLLTGLQLTAEELHRRGAIEACLKESELMPFAYHIARHRRARPQSHRACTRQSRASGGYGGTRRIPA